MDFMPTALEFEDSDLDPRERKFLTEIRKYGWFNTRVFDPDQIEPDFSYSTGIFESVGFPEIIVFSLPKQVSHDILWDIYRDLADGKSFASRTKIPGIFGNHDAVLMPVAKSKYGEHLGWSQWFYRGDDFPCLQLIWPDREGLFPWEAYFDQSFVDDQPDLSGIGWGNLKIE
jgi:hypothetical protein